MISHLHVTLLRGICSHVTSFFLGLLWKPHQNDSKEASLAPLSALALPLHHSLPHFIPLHLALPHHTEPQVLWEGGPYSGRAKVLVSGVKNVDG